MLVGQGCRVTVPACVPSGGLSDVLCYGLLNTNATGSFYKVMVGVSGNKSDGLFKK